MYVMFDSYAIEEFSSSSLQAATQSIVNVPIHKSPLDYSQNTSSANESEFGLSQLPTFS